MEKGDGKISFLLDGGIADRRAPELRAPVAEQLGSPLLARSDNTRLSVVMGAGTPAPGLQSVITGLPDECHGIIPGGPGGSALALFRGPQTRIIYGSRVAYKHRAYNTLIGAVITPGRVLGGGSSMLAMAPGHPASAVDPDTGYVWHTSYQRNGLSVYIEDSAGQMVTSPQLVQVNVTDDYSYWSGLTSHGENTMFAWFYRPGTGLLKYEMIYRPHASYVEVIGGVELVYLPANDALPDVQRYDEDRVMIYGGDASTAASATLRLHNVHTDAETTATPVSVGATAGYAVAMATIDGEVRIATMACTSTGPAVYVGLYDSDLTAIWNETKSTTYAHGECAVGFYAGVGSGISGIWDPWCVVGVSSTIEGKFSQAPPDRMESVVNTFLASDGSPTGNPKTYAWKRLLGRCIQLSFSENELIPMFPMCTMYADDAKDPSNPDYVDDPAYEIYQFGMDGPGPNWGNLFPIARVGVVRGTMAPAHIAVTGLPNATQQNAVVDGRLLVFAYLNGVSTQSVLDVDDVDPPEFLDHASNIVRIDFGPSQLLTASDRSGKTIVAGALPLSWDGSELLEYGGPLSRPHVYVAPTTIDEEYRWAEGSYGIAAYMRRRDAAGETTRSRVSNVSTYDSTGLTAPFVYVTVVHGMTRRPFATFGAFELVVAGTPTNQVDYRDLSTFARNDLHYSSVTNLPEPQLSHPIIYSDGTLGQELMPHPPPPLADVAIIGARAWGIDGEFRFRGVFSKLRVGGVGYEFNPALEVLFPRVGGELTRVFEVSGVAVFLAERAVWQVTGPGPNNALGGASFSAPIKVSDYGCSDPLSAQSFPGGIVWSSAGRWFVMRGATVLEVPNVKANVDITCAVHMREQDEIVFYGRQTSDDPGPAESDSGDFLIYEHDLSLGAVPSILIDDDGAFLVYGTEGSSTAPLQGVGAPIAKVYNYLLDRWSRWVSPVVGAYEHATNLPNELRRHLAFLPGEIRVVDGESYASDCTMVYETDWTLLLGDFHDHVVISDVLLNGEYVTAHTVQIEVFTDYRQVPTTTRSWSDVMLRSIMDEQQSAPRYSIRLEPAEQDTRAVRVRVTVTTIGSGAGGRALALTICFKPFAPLREEAFSRVLGGFQ